MNDLLIFLKETKSSKVKLSMSKSLAFNDEVTIQCSAD